ncbi:protein transport protein gos1 [Mycoemilia scoparia]|uniref:Protein transport protein gos1 n=1 Tax=Mycoemilia scoparia TaxID=417184 RepID=A0A9W7ZX03_9FUNG|nr:protein transport protein gos1 [Mycoemilia scoparia]
MAVSDSITIKLNNDAAALRTWEQLRRDARNVETKLQNSILEYGQHQQTVRKLGSNDSSTDPSADNLKLQLRSEEKDIELLLQELHLIIKEIEEIISLPESAKNLGKQGQSVSVHTLQRHQNYYDDYKRDFLKYKNIMWQQLDHNELLGNGGVRGLSGRELSDQEQLIRERERIEQAHNNADMIINQALSIGADLHEQRSMLARATGRLTDVTEPAIVIRDFAYEVNDPRHVGEFDPEIYAKENELAEERDNEDGEDDVWDSFVSYKQPLEENNKFPSNIGTSSSDYSSLQFDSPPQSAHPDRLVSSSSGKDGMGFNSNGPENIAGNDEGDAEFNTSTPNNAKNDSLSGLRSCRALYDFEAENPTELSFKENDTLFIMYKQCHGWLLGFKSKNNTLGLIPENYVEFND